MVEVGGEMVEAGGKMVVVGGENGNGGGVSRGVWLFGCIFAV